jgi:hypothetical protein
LATIQASVKVHGGAVTVVGAGSAGPVMDAALALEQAHRLQPTDPVLHYAWVSALHIAAQFKAAHEEMSRLTQAKPEFLLARFAFESRERWVSPFELPEWSDRVTGALPLISPRVRTAVLLPVRDGLLPRAALFLRDANGDFQDVNLLRTARIDMTTVISEIKNPQVVAINARIWDNPRDPYPLEVLDFPLCQRGRSDRSKYEYLCLQEDIDFAVIDARDRLLMNKRIPIPEPMRRVNRQLLELLKTQEGIEIPMTDPAADQWYRTVGRPAIKAHQSRLQPSDVQY